MLSGIGGHDIEELHCCTLIRQPRFSFKRRVSEFDDRKRSETPDTFRVCRTRMPAGVIMDGQLQLFPWDTRVSCLHERALQIPHSWGFLQERSFGVPIFKSNFVAHAAGAPRIKAGWLALGVFGFFDQSLLHARVTMHRRHEECTGIPEAPVTTPLSGRRKLSRWQGSPVARSRINHRAGKGSFELFSPSGG